MKLLRNYIILLFFLATFISIEPTKPKVTLSLIMRNEAGRKLREMLEEVKHYIDEAVIIDDASTDRSVTICHEVLQGIPLHIIQNTQSKFSNEINLRKQQWEETIKTDPEWILNIDADHIFEKAMREEMNKLINQEEIDVWCFRVYDLWSETHYRDDQYWMAHNTYRAFLIRYKKDFPYEWKETPQHCGHFPKNIYNLKYANSSIRLKHYGWAKAEDRFAKYERYLKLDPGAKYGWKAQYDSILDKNPHLVEWIE